MVRLIVILILAVLLTSCSTLVLTPTTQMVEKAIALQLDITKQLLQQKVDLDFQGFEINHLRIKKQKAVNYQKLPTYHIQGTYDLTFKVPDKKVSQPQNPFDIYLQLQKEGKTWRLIFPEISGKENKTVWRSYLVN
ncbi:MAG: hypothetical protein VKL59_03280 [Nostocaceae cyanobacterium]|nr:hypothetical protein [Nostocaceae cyanobacterium]